MALLWPIFVALSFEHYDPNLCMAVLCICVFLTVSGICQLWRWISWKVVIGETGFSVRDVFWRTYSAGYSEVECEHKNGRAVIRRKGEKVILKGVYGCDLKPLIKKIAAKDPRAIDAGVPRG